MEEEAIFGRIRLINTTIDNKVQQRLNRKKTFFEIDIEHLHPKLFHAWIGQYNGVTKYGETFTIYYNGNSWTTGPNTPAWIFWMIVNDGKVKDYIVNDQYHRIQNLNFRSVGNNRDKARVRADFTFLNHDGDWVPLGK